MGDSRCDGHQRASGVVLLDGIIDLPEARIVHRQIGALKCGTDEERKREIVSGKQDARQDPDSLISVSASTHSPCWQRTRVVLHDQLTLGPPHTSRPS